jgi:predicted transcriptional regulator
MPETREIKKTSDTVAILDRMAGESPERRRLTEEARINAAVAQLIYAARTKARLSQAELADKLGTKQSVISRLEDADYEGHSLGMLQRIWNPLVERGGQVQESIGIAHTKKWAHSRTDKSALTPCFGLSIWEQEGKLEEFSRSCF